MKVIVLCIVLFATGCSGQETSKLETRIDTALLFNPKPYPIDGKDDMFKNCLLLIHQQYGLNIQGQVFQIQNDEAAFTKFKTNKPEILKSKFFIVVDSSVSFDRTLDVIEHLKGAGIENYQVLNYENLFRRLPPPVIVAQEPTAVSTILSNNDSTFLGIEFLQTGYLISFLNKKTTLKNDIELDNFIHSNTELINKNEVQIVVTKQTSERVRTVLPIFRKYEIQKFSILNK